MRRRAAVALAVTALLAVGCGRQDEATKALRETESTLDGIRSGVLSMRLLASSTTAAEGQGVGFEIDGPFAVATRKGTLPVADLRYTRVTGSARRTTRFVSTGARAFIEADGRLTELGEDQLAGLRVRDEGSSGGLEGLSLRRWLTDPTVTPGPVIDGAPTEQITGTADPVAILNDIIGLSEQYGAADGPVQRLDGDAADRVRRSVGATAARLVTGRDDRLLRQAEVSVELRVADQKVREALGDLAGARLTLALEVTRLNQPVEVAEPTPSRAPR